MLKKTINISSFDNAKKFVNLTSKYDDVRMRIRVDDYEVDAHSIVGVLSIVDTESKAVFTADVPDGDTQLLHDIEPFVVKDV